MTDLFFDIATSAPALGLDVLLLLAALVVGHVPFGKYMPVIGPYVPVARVAAPIAAAVLFFFLGARVMDERQELQNLRATLLTKQADIEAAAKSAADAKARATIIEKWSNAQSKADADFIATLEARDACPFDPGAVAPARGLSKPEPIWRWRFGAGARSPAETR